jgi:hypothetical protein
MHKVAGGWRPSLSAIAKINPNLSTLIRKCWAQKPADRPGFQEVLTYINSVLDENGENEYYMSTELRHHAD